ALAERTILHVHEDGVGVRQPYGPRQSGFTHVGQFNLNFVACERVSLLGFLDPDQLRDILSYLSLYKTAVRTYARGDLKDYALNVRVGHFFHLFLGLIGWRLGGNKRWFGGILKDALSRNEHDALAFGNFHFLAFQHHFLANDFLEK